MSRLRLVILVVLAMVAFAGNSLLCRMALKHTNVDPASFTAMRLFSGACMLWCVVWLRHGKASNARAAAQDGGNWLSACALFVYAAAFSYAYVSMSAATGALLLFGTVQATMVGYGVWQGERLRRWQLVGLGLAVAGLVMLMLPGLAAPSLLGSVSMMSAGAAWGIYSLRGKGAGDPTRVTAGNFLRTLPMALVLSLLMSKHLSLDVAGLALAVLSGALASGLGYALWYQALPVLPATQAASVQLSVPVIAALGAIVFIGEPLTWPAVLASITILGGIALVILNKKQTPSPRAHIP